MTLLGWTNPLPLYLQVAVEAGLLKVILVQPKKGDAYEILQGIITNPQGTILEFQ